MNIELRGKDEHYYICDFSEAVYLRELPWGKGKFDVSILAFDEPFAGGDAVRKLIEKLVSRNTDWFETLGVKAENLHDEIDLASVRIGRQKTVGDGSPMTAWFEEVSNAEDMAEHIVEYPLGSCDNRVVIIIGTHKDFDRVVDAIKKTLTQR